MLWWIIYGKGNNGGIVLTNHRQFLQRFLPVENSIRGYILATTGNPSETEDLLQNVAATLWERLDAFDPNRPFVAWALGFARIEILRWRQSKARSHSALSVEAAEMLLEDAQSLAEEIDAQRGSLRQCLEGLGEAARRAIELKYYKGLPIAGVAKRLSRSVSAVEMLLVRARRSLRACMERRLRQAVDSKA